MERDFRGLSGTRRCKEIQIQTIDALQNNRTPSSINTDKSKHQKRVIDRISRANESGFFGGAKSLVPESSTPKQTKRHAIYKFPGSKRLLR
ncbi:hypothetical protein L596_024086 [Steinernema carpocapsae]|uniref:Uncharacterized protein n=1 Tax=Steinernema carpocapsae TaxID=34508 RepID=A0A4U5MFN3_STECR|nr:hypothetical protein L596_024086 [Steinernema carpocapsae]